MQGQMNAVEKTGREVLRTLYSTLDALGYVPMSKTDDRLRGRFYDARVAGLITEDERIALVMYFASGS